MIGAVQAGFLFPYRLCKRWARLLRDVQSLTVEGSTEPRRWIACAEGFWVGVADDCAESLRLLGFGAALPTFGFLRPVDVTLKPGQSTCEIPVDVPIDAFRTLHCDELRIWPSQLRCGDERVASPGRNLRMTPSTVARSEPATLLRVYDLPALVGGTVLYGMVWAEPADPFDCEHVGAITIASVRIYVEK